MDEKRIKHILSGVRKPTTIGKAERWRRTMKDELISRVKNLNKFKMKLLDFVEYYNFKRTYFGYEGTEISKDVRKRRKIHFIPAGRYRDVLMKRGSLSK